MFEEEVELDGNVSRLQSAWSRKWQNWLDRSAPHTGMRWGFASLIMLIYCLRVYLINGERQRPRRSFMPRPLGSSQRPRRRASQVGTS